MMTEEVSYESAYSQNYSSPGIAEPPKKQIFRLQIPFGLRLALVWTIFFSVVGVGIQYYQNPQSQPVLMNILKGFFTTEYASWFKSFGGFVDVSLYGSTLDVFYSIMNQWYYFFYTGGLLALIWGILSWIINFELVVNKTPKYAKIKQEAEQQNYQLSHNLKINELLLETRRLLSEGKLQDAKDKYNEARISYDITQDPDKKIKAEAIDIYNEILEKEKQEANKKLG
jgi:hypothetical protein